MKDCPFCGNDGEGSHIIECVAKLEDVPFAYTKTDLKDVKTQAEATVKVVQPVSKCAKCDHSWTDMTGEVIRDMVVPMAREQAEKVIKDCPCCGRKQSTEEWVLIDALYPSGIWYVHDEDLGGFRFQSHKERTADAKPIWQYHCNQSSGGCGLEITGYTAQECIDNWNARPSKGF